MCRDLITQCFTRVTTSNDYALETIQAANVPPSSLVDILPFPIYTHDPTKAAVIKTFLLSMDTIGRQMFHLHKEAEVSMGHLIHLGEHLLVLHEMITRS